MIGRGVSSSSEWFGQGEPGAEGARPEGTPRGGGPGGRRPPSLTFGRRRGPLVPTLIVLVVLGFIVSLMASLWTEILWFSSVGYEQVFVTELTTKILLFVVGFVLTAAVVASSLVIGYRTRPIYAPVTPQQQNLDQYREAIEPLRKVAMFAIPAILGLLAGTGAAGQWQAFLLWRNKVSFGSKDPQFGLDLSFFVFTLPWIQFVLGFLTMALVMATLAAAFTHYVYGGLQIQSRAERTSRAARTHLAILVAALVLVRAATYWFDRYALSTKDSRLFTGIGYTDAHAVLPTKAILAIAALMTVGLFIASIWTRSWRLPIIGVALLLITSIVAGSIYPALYQRFKVKPSEKSLEQVYIDRNIKATRAAYGIADVKTQSYTATTEATQGQLRDDAETIPGIRLVDPIVVSPTFKQLQSVKSYYAFPDALDVDRYTVDGKVRDTVLAVRELDLNGIPANQRNWLNDHTVYTHGFGLVAAFGNQRTPDGAPVFYERNIPQAGELPKFEPRIYFGEQSPSYSIVGAPTDQSPVEFDYPDASSSGERRTKYTGRGGVAMGTFARRFAFAIAQQDLNILVSDRINARSRILFDRHPRERVEKVAPWLTLDGDPYPAVVNGRVQWILDGFTTSDAYPNSQNTTLQAATSDSLTERTRSVAALANRRVNYLRNSVKATVDAYDGTVTLYAWDPSDPVLKAWMGVFKNTVKPLSQISGQLMSHLRYPEDLFKVQRALLGRYHVSDAQSFYSGNDFWRVPDDPTQTGAVDQPPYFLTLQMPGQTAPSFSLTSTFIPAGGARNVLTAFAAVDANAGTETGKKRDGYGTIRVLQLPKDTVVSGPGQVQNNFNSNTTVSNTLNLLRQGGSTKVENGNLLTLPVGGGLLYVQPVYVRGTGTTSYPLLQKVLVSFGDKIGFADTLDAALDQVFGGNSGASAGDAGAGGTGTGSGTTGGGTTGGGTTSSAAQLKQALADAQKAIQDGQAALAKGDFAAYGEAQKRLAAALQRATQASGSTPSPSPSAK
jgi:uncharacterized membrane protein (UPF0182 family)